MSLRRWIRGIGVAALAVAAMAFISGCDDDEGDSGSGGSVAGTWQMTSKLTGNLSWWVFNNDGTFVSYDDQARTRPHIIGSSYKQEGNTVTGTFVNPGVGDGEINATISDDGKTMTLDFIEHWHTPFKHCPYTGTKL